MIELILLSAIAWTDQRPRLMLACAGICFAVLLWVESQP